ncbi:MAG: multidrug effflux MFS transporter [Alphaproteobacteria bacterium]|nr:multidrug effflux MFS transporter [Candidatus Jidaibacter sp.]
MMNFITIIITCILAGAEVDLFIPSFPELQKEFGLTPFLVELTLSVNMIAYCVGSLIAGNMGDKYGRKKVILLGMFIFLIGSLLCIFASSFYIMLIGRVLQGLGVSAPAVLSFVIIADEYPIEKQQELMGVLNGVIALAMSLAPIIGSYVNLYFGWHGNFVVLFLLCAVGMVMCQVYIKETAPRQEVSLSVKSYFPILRSTKANLYIASICLFVMPYWVFIALAPILYITDIGVPLHEFGFYQGALAGTFGIVSLLSGRFIKIIGNRNYFIIGCIFCMAAIFSITIISALGVMDPMVITACVLLFSIGVVPVVNLLYPHSLESVHNAKGRVAAWLQAVRLIITALSIGFVSANYKGEFDILGFFIAISLMAALICTIITISRYKVFPRTAKEFESEEPAHFI